MLTRLSIRLKVMVAPLIVMLLCVAVSAGSIWLLRGQGQAFREVVGGAFDTATTTSRMSLAVAAIHSDVVRHIDLPGSDSGTEARAELRARLPERFDKVASMLQSIETNAISLDADLLHAIGEFLSIYRIVATRAMQDKPNPVLVSSLMAHYSQLDTYLNQLADITTRAAKERQQRSESFVARSVNLMLFAVATAIALGLLATWSIGRAISAPLVQMTDVMSRLAQGEHEVHVPARERLDEVGRMAQALEAFRLANERLRMHERELAEMVDRLAVMRDQAAEASRAKSDFLASMSHELRTPLNAVLGYAQLLQWNPAALTAQQRTSLKTIEQAGQHLLELIDEILDLSRIEAGRLELHLTPVALQPFLQSIANIIRVRVEQKGVLFCHEAEGLPPAVMADERRLRQVLLNLLSNAAKFTDHGSVTLCARAEREDAGTVRLALEVTDTGVGISPAELRTLFQPFQQVGDQQRRRGGTGLGLVISQQLVRHMGGELQVHSVPGEGSRFGFVLQLVSAGTPQLAEHDAPVVLGYEGPRKRLLVVDDVPQNRALLADMLGPLGFEIEEAVDGEQGVARAAAHPPDLVLMDYVMPVMNGLEATRRMRQLPTLRDVPVIAISASAVSDGQARALSAGASAFITKPFKAGELLSLLEQHLHIRFLRA
ncbi:ATP-binding protein [Ideonella sp. BN130291]|uniref:ATP-binding protein n=1 Tax=Ideonella sp. BN130291 TaxID=3112940 RepID=UPI002E268BCB|nr:ATP-binding protein [Ideonella sp. BN130291]